MGVVSGKVTYYMVSDEHAATGIRILHLSSGLINPPLSGHLAARVLLRPFRSGLTGSSWHIEHGSGSVESCRRESDILEKAAGDSGFGRENKLAVGLCTPKAARLVEPSVPSPYAQDPGRYGRKERTEAEVTYTSV